MSTTFSIEINPTGRFVLAPACAEPGQTAVFGDIDGTRVVPGIDGRPAYSDHEAALDALVSHKGECEDCAAYGCYTQIETDLTDTFDVRLAEAQAQTVLVFLGYEDTDGDRAGSASPNEFLGRVLPALGTIGTQFGVSDEAVAPSHFQATDNNGKPVGPLVVDCGVPTGYYAEALTRLADLGTEAKRLGRDIVWC